MREDESHNLAEYDEPYKPCPRGCGRTMPAWRYADECQVCAWERPALQAQAPVEHPGPSSQTSADASCESSTGRSRSGTEEEK